MRALTILAACTVGIITGTVVLSADAAGVKGEEMPQGTMCTGPADMDPDTDYVYGECSQVCRGKEIKRVDGDWDCTGSFDKLSMEIALPADDSSSRGVSILIPVDAISDLVQIRVNRVSSAPAKTPTNPIKMNFRKKKYTTIVPSAALAQSKVVWSFDAMACVPAGAPIARDLYDSLAGRVRFREGKTGSIALICPISDDLGNTLLRSLRLTYRDGDGKEGPSVVTAAIRRVRRSDGHVVTLPNGDVSSNDSNAVNSGSTGWATHQSGAPSQVLSHALDLDKFYYYVQIGMKRTDAAVPLVVMGVHLIN